MEAHRFHKPAIVAIWTLVATLVSSLVIVPEAAGQAAPEWQTSVIPTMGHTVSANGHFGIDNAGEKVMIAFQDSSPTVRIVVAVKDNASAGWATKTENAINGMALTVVGEEISIGWSTGTTWFMGFYGGTATDQFTTLKSTDDGATWVKQSSDDFGNTVVAAPHMDVIEGTDDLVVVFAISSDCNNGVCFKKSTDGGVSWGPDPANILNDNQGGSAAATATLSTQSFAAIKAVDANHYIVQFTSASNGDIYRVETFDGGFLWSTPYVNNGSTTLAPVAACVGNAAAALISGIGSDDTPIITAVIETDTTPNKLCSMIDSSEDLASGNANDISVVGRHWVDGDHGIYLMAGGDMVANTNYVWVKQSPDTAWVLSHSNSADTNQLAVLLTPTTAYHIYVDNSNGGQLRSDQASDIPTIELVAASNTATVTGLNAFDVDPSGVTAIARTDGGQYVRVYPAGTLQSPASKDTDCAAVGGVATMSNHVAYFDCDVSGNVVQVEIRSPSLTSPSKPSVCSDAGFCIEDIPTECGVDPGVACVEGDQDDDTHLAIVEELPVDYSIRQSQGFDDSVYVAMAFADTTGKLGVWTYTMNNNADDTSDVVSVGIANQAPDMICSHQDPNGYTYVYGSSYSSNVQGFRVSFSYSGGSGGVDDTVTPSMTRVFPGSGSTAGPEGVACGDNKVAILNSAKLTVWNRTSGGQSSSPHLTVSGLTSVPNRGIAMSHDGNWVAYVSGGAWKIIDSTEGALACQGTLPAGSFKGMELHGSGSSLWIATDTSIARYSTFDCTTGEDIVFDDCSDPEDLDCDGIRNSDDADRDGDGLIDSEDPDDDGDGIVDALDNDNGDTGSVGGAGGNIIRPAGTVLPPGFTDATFDFLLGILFVAALTVGLAVGLYAPTKSAKVASVGGGVGGVSGFLGAFAMGFWPWWMMLVLVVIAILVVFIGILRGRSG